MATDEPAPLPHAAIYDAAAIYDLAFSYRDYARECAYLRRVAEAVSGAPPRRVLELAAGPARHGLELAAGGAEVVALDRAASMAAFAEAEAVSRGLWLRYVVADMVDFMLPATFDLAACMLCSATYLLDDDAMVRHLRHVAAVLAERGVYVLELPHPSELEGAPVTRHTWSARDARGEVDVEWVDEADDGAVKRVRARFTFRPAGGGPAQVVEDVSRQRTFTLAELEALAARSGRFRVAAVHGALDERVPLLAPGAWRMLVVLEKLP